MATATRTTENLPTVQAGAHRVAAIVPSNFAEVVQIAGAIVRADMAPASYKGSVEKATVAIMAGMEVGLTPFAALQSIAVINGTPALFGDGLVALVRASGLLEDMQEGLDVAKDGQPMLAWCKVKRKGEASWKERELNWVECVKAGWTRKQGPWSLTPGRMMTIRVRGWLFRDIFADVLKGLKSAEEVQDMVDVTHQGSATVATEPQRKDFVEQTTQTPSEPSPPARSDGSGEPAAPLPRAADSSGGGDSKPEAPAAPETTAVTDVEDQNEQPQDGVEHNPKRPLPGEKLEFARFNKVGEFCDFADAFLPETNREGAMQFEAKYDGTLVAMERGKKGSQEAAAEIRATLKKLIDAPREPGEEG